MIWNSIWFSNFFKHLWCIINKFENLLLFLNVWLPLILISKLSNIIKFIDLIIRRIKESIHRSFYSKHNIKHEIELITSKSDVICALCMLFFFLFFWFILLVFASFDVSMMYILNDISSNVWFCFPLLWAHGFWKQKFKILKSLRKCSYWSMNNINLFSFLDCNISVLVSQLLCKILRYSIICIPHSLGFHKMERMISIILVTVFRFYLTALSSFVLIFFDVVLTNKLTKLVVFVRISSIGSISLSSTKHVSFEDIHEWRQKSWSNRKYIIIIMIFIHPSIDIRVCQIKLPMFIRLIDIELFNFSTPGSFLILI